VFSYEAGGDCKLYKLDHIVHFVSSPEEAMEQLETQGLHVVAGGKHEQWGTYNALCYFDSAYIELIGIYDREKFLEASTVPFSLHETYAKNYYENGLTRVALSTTTIEEDAKKFQQAGFKVIGPERFSRTRPDGSVVSWQLLHVGSEDLQIDLPFFIQWDQPEQQLQSLRTIQNHPAGPIKIEEVSFVVSNFNTAHALLELYHFEHTQMTNSKLKADVLKIHTPTGTLAFYCPIDEGDVWNMLMERGQSICSIVLAGAIESKVLHVENANYVFQ